MTVTINWEKLLPSDRQLSQLKAGDTFIHSGGVYMFRAVARRRLRPYDRFNTEYAMRAFCLNLGTGEYEHLDPSTVVEPVDIEITVVRK